MNDELFPIGDELAENPEPRLPCLLLVDSSGSMSASAGGRSKITMLNEGLSLLKSEMLKDGLTSLRVEVAVVSFGGTVRVESDFALPDNWSPPTLFASGGTPMYEAICVGLDLLRARMEKYRKAANRTFTPWVFLLSDGAPTDTDSCGAVNRVHAGDSAQKGVERFLFYSILVGPEPQDNGEMDPRAASYSFGRLVDIAPPRRPPIVMNPTRFKELFQFISQSAIAQSNSVQSGGTPNETADVMLAPLDKFAANWSKS